MDWPTSKVVQPMAIRRCWLLRQLRATLRPTKPNSSKNISSITEPTKPNSSAKTAKIKSVLWIGRYCSFWVERPNPSPRKPPEPIAIKLCTSW